MRGMRRYRASTMGLYAMFIAFVGVPLLAATADMSIVWLRRAELSNAVDAACSAYAHTPDIPEYRRHKVLRLGPEARSEGYKYFGMNMTKDGALTGMRYSVSPTFPDTVIATCTGSASVRPIVFVGFASFDISHTSTVKAKFGTSTNWR